jgi:hypothetical protein
MTDKRTAAGNPPATLEAGAREAAYVVCHSGVGKFWRGQTVTAADLGAPQEALSEAQLQRLLDLEAIAPVGSRKAQDVLTDLGENAQTPTGDRVDDAEAVRRQVSEAYASLGKPVPAG